MENQTIPSRKKVPHLAEGCRVAAGWFNPHRPRVEKIIIIGRIGRMNAHRPRAPRKHSLRGWNPGGGVSRPARRGVGLIRAPLSVRRSTNNVENVGVRLWQSSYNMSAGECPQCLFYLLDRHGRFTPSR